MEDPLSEQEACASLPGLLSLLNEDGNLRESLSPLKPEIMEWDGETQYSCTTRVQGPTVLKEKKSV